MREHTRPVEPSENTPTEQPVFGMKRAAEIAGISVSTIKRHKSQLEECGAVLSPDGWKVPISALVASGLMRSTTPGDTHPEAEKGPQNGAQGHSEVHELERQIMELKHRAELAEERQRAAEEQARSARELVKVLNETLTVERRMITGGQLEPQKIRDSDLRRSSDDPSGKAVVSVSEPHGWWKKVFTRRNVS